MKEIQVPSGTDFTGWILAGIGTAVSTLAGLVAFFYRQQVSDYHERDKKNEAKIVMLEKRADACESDREELRIKHAVLEERVTKLESTKKTV